MVGLALFTVASLVCGLSQSDEMLIAARAVQGLGAAIVSPGGPLDHLGDLHGGLRTQ